MAVSSLYFLVVADPSVDVECERSSSRNVPSNAEASTVRFGSAIAQRSKTSKTTFAPMKIGGSVSTIQSGSNSFECSLFCTVISIRYLCEIVSFYFPHTCRSFARVIYIAHTWYLGYLFFIYYPSLFARGNFLEVIPVVTRAIECERDCSVRGSEREPEEKKTGNIQDSRLD